MHRQFLVRPAQLAQAFESGSGSGSGITRRSFIKRTGGATVATLVAWETSKTKLHAEDINGGNCPHSDHGEWDGRSDEALGELADNWLAEQEAKTPNPFLAILWGAVEEAHPKTNNPQPLNIEDIGQAFLEEVGQGLLDLAKDPAKEWFEHLLEDHARTKADKTLFLTSGIFLGIGALEGYIRAEDSPVEINIPISSIAPEYLKHQWECSDGILELELSGDIKLSFDGSLLNPDIDSWGLKFMLRYIY